jgi:hypothetical protein
MSKLASPGKREKIGNASQRAQGSHTVEMKKMEPEEPSFAVHVKGIEIGAHGTGRRSWHPRHLYAASVQVATILPRLQMVTRT